MTKQRKSKKGKKLRIFFLLIAIVVYILTNLSWNQIYYYTHSKKTDKKLTPIVLIYNLGDVMTKPKREKDGKYEYISPGNAINYSKTSAISFSFSQGDGTTELNTSLSSYNSDTDTLIGYHLSTALKITAIFKYTPDAITEEKPTAEDQKMVDHYVKQLTDHVLKTRVDPPLLFNLQWLYDLTYDEKKVLHLEEK